MRIYILTLILIVFSNSVAYAKESDANIYWCAFGWLGHNNEEVSTQCKGGRQTSTLECCNTDESKYICAPQFNDCASIYSKDRTFDCNDPINNCASLVAEYNTCSGPIGPFLVDEKDNVYFWSGQWQLHSLDSKGKLRWRYEICTPDEHPYSLPISQCYQGDKSKCDWSSLSFIPSMVMDYYGVVYFIVSNYLYAIDSKKGTLIFKNKINVPEPQNAPAHTFVSNGSYNGNSRNGFNLGDLVLAPNGLLSASIVIQRYDDKQKSYEPYNNLDNQNNNAIVTMTRKGDVFEYKENPDTDGTHEIYTSNVVGTKDSLAQVVLATSRLKSEGTSTVRIGNNSYEYPTKISHPHGFWSNHPMGSVAVGPHNNYLISLSTHGGVVAFNLKTKEIKTIFKAPGSRTFSWQNRPVFDDNGYLWLQADPNEIANPILFQLDVDTLWHTPFTDDTFCPDAFKDQYCEQFQENAEPIDYTKVPGVLFVKTKGDAGGGYSTPLLTKERIYAPLGGLWAFDTKTKKRVWRFGNRTMATAPAMLSDGTIVVGQGTTGRVFFIKENNLKPTPLSKNSWQRAYHDNYHSNHSEHPLRWDRTKPAPYPPVQALPDPKPWKPMEPMMEPSIMEPQPTPAKGCCSTVQTPTKDNLVYYFASLGVLFLVYRRKRHE